MDALHDKPIDMNAVKVVFFKGVHFNPTLSRDKGRHQRWYDNPPETIHPPIGVRNILGLTRGSMTITGYIKHVPMAKGKGLKHIWLARCSCGRYETRDGKNWYSGYREGKEDMCHYCSYAWRLSNPKK